MKNSKANLSFVEIPEEDMCLFLDLFPTAEWFRNHAFQNPEPRKNASQHLVLYQLGHQIRNLWQKLTRNNFGGSRPTHQVFYRQTPSGKRQKIRITRKGSVSSLAVIWTGKRVYKDRY